MKSSHRLRSGRSVRRLRRRSCAEQSATRIRTGPLMTATKQSKCRFCGSKLEHTFVDLGMSPLCESFLPGEHLNQMEAFYPLHAYVCGDCFLVQLEAYVTPEHMLRAAPKSSPHRRTRAADRTLPSDSSAR